jgi:hypothetical protein
MKRAILILFAIWLGSMVALTSCTPACSQDIFRIADAKQLVEEKADKSFHRQIVKATQEAAKRGEISRIDALKLRIAFLSPAFRQHAEDLAIVQMYFHDPMALPLSADGSIERANIDWSKLMDYLIKLLPLFLEIMRLIG